MLQDITIITAGIIILGSIVFLVSKNWKRSIQVMSGWGIYEAYNFTWDFVIWPIIQAIFGYVGVILLIIVALINNFAILFWYQWKKVDWFGVNEIEDIKAKGHLWVHEVSNHKNLIKRFSLYIPAKILQFMIWLLNKNDIFAFVTLSIWQDSFLTTIFLRHGKFTKLDRRDYMIFVSSTILSCVGWAIFMQIIISAIRAFWSLL